MMPDLNAWLGTSGLINSTTRAEARAALAWKRINDKPTSVVFTTGAGAVLSAQIVRLEYDDGVSEAQSVTGPTPVRRLVIFGIKDHATEPDTVVDEGYRLWADGDEYTCIDVIYSIGEVQAIFEAV